MIDFDLEDPVVEPIIKEYLFKTSYRIVKDICIIGYEVKLNGIIINMNVYTETTFNKCVSTSSFFLDNSFFEKKIIPEIRERKLNQILDVK